MKILNLLSAALCLVLFTSCENVEVDKTPRQNLEREERPEKSEQPDEKKMNIDSLATTMADKRDEIENSELTLMEVPTDRLKEKTKQKWEKIHFYHRKGELLRIKTYPYPNITSRTEEFYFEDGELFLAVIEDDGLGEKDEAAADIDKSYFFYDGELVHEIHNTDEREYSLRKSDAEELQTEVREYVDIYQSRSDK